jgi:hypothetical protein
MYIFEDEVEKIGNVFIHSHAYEFFGAGEEGLHYILQITLLFFCGKCTFPL